MPTSISSNMPPVTSLPPAGTQTSDRWGNVISTRPVPAPQQPASTSTAPTSDRYGNIISTPKASTSSNMPPVTSQPPAGTQTSDRWGNVISTRPVPAPEQPSTSPAAPTCDKYGNIISAPAGWTSNPAHVPIPGTNFVPNESGVVDWK